MKIEKAVVNASPLILLFKSGLIGLLPQLFTEIIVPDAVWREIIAGGESDRAAARLPNISWLRRATVPAILPEVLAWSLGDGESEVLSFALTHAGYVAMIDDKAARRCARTLKIQTLGTGGALVLAKRRHLIPSVSAELQRLQAAGIWLSDEIIALLKTQAGE